MIRFIAYRVLQAVPTLVGITLVSFLLLHIVPGGPATVMLGDRATPQLIAQINQSLGLNKPLYVQYWIWLVKLLHGNLGYAYSYHQTVSSLIAVNLPRTLALVVTAIILSHLFAILIGVFQAVRRDSAADHTLTVITYLLYSMPTFWLGMIVISIFAIGLNLLPAGGLSNPFATNPTFGDYLRHMILPAAVLVATTIPNWSRYVRSRMMETLVQDYIRTAHAKGLRNRTILVRHALKNSLLPLITLAGMSLPALFSGALIIEMIFNYPGMGLLFWNAAQARDYPVLLGIVVMVGVLTILGNLLADIIYGVVDPRVKYE
ncbi:ABC transporter permease [Alicyclobacillus mengziensis]|uniref:ABC transporter permease n=1 Tax=Alicyclobacillus mengziensis TaxID=2931921 RepID=A0A9X7Z6C9_9BACL|nr:ABC transporter permease [Alicyclobacillus mengziensis]QSO47237.1 ABC transporter permease [Alicyclobacillus mengziensis]